MELGLWGWWIRLPTGASAYTNGGLVAFNVIYNNGGAGVHDQNSEYVTIANNSCYNNYLDTNNNATARSCIDTLYQLRQHGHQQHRLCDRRLRQPCGQHGYWPHRT